MNKKVYSWIWKWHFLGGIISLPIIILLSITGIIYLFKDDYEKTNAEYLTELELKFKNNQDLIQAVEDALVGLHFTKEATTDGVIFKVEDSPISEIELKHDTFYLRTNRDKWIAYY